MHLQGLTPGAELSLLAAAGAALKAEVESPVEGAELDEGNLSLQVTQQVLKRAARKALVVWLDPTGLLLRETNVGGETEIPSSLKDWASSVSSDGKQEGTDVVVSEMGRREQALERMVELAAETLRDLPISRTKLHASVLQHLWRKAANEQSSVWHEEPLDSEVGTTVAEALVQDCVVGVAEACATAYMGSLRRREGGMLGGALASLLVHEPPRWLRSTRALEKFRNEVVAAEWMGRNSADVVAIFEDRHPLLGFTPNGTLIRRQLPMCRQDELAQLSGWRQNFSVILEMADVCIPLMQGFFTYIGDALSWILVRLIGRSLGLIYRGVRQSLSPQA